MTKTFALMLIAAGLGAGAAGAQPSFTVYGSTEPTARVSYADLNLNSSEGIERLQLRVRSAARDLCLEYNVDPLNISMERRRCYRKAVDGGFAQIDRLVADKMAGKAALASAILITAR